MTEFEVVDAESGEVGVYTSRFPLRSSYNYDTDKASLASGFACVGKTMAQQQFKEECDINTIVENFGLTGQMPQNVRVPINEEFVESLDYQSSLNIMMEAENAFMQFPAKIRDEFGNDPVKFVNFVSDPANVDRCREWGLANAKAQAPEPLAVRVVPEAGTS